MNYIAKDSTFSFLVDRSRPFFKRHIFVRNVTRARVTLNITMRRARLTELSRIEARGNRSRFVEFVSGYPKQLRYVFNKRVATIREPTKIRSTP